MTTDGTYRTNGRSARGPGVVLCYESSTEASQPTRPRLIRSLYTLIYWLADGQGKSRQSRSPTRSL